MMNLDLWLACFSVPRYCQKLNKGSVCTKPQNWVSYLWTCPEISKQRWEICSKLIKTPEWRQWRCSSVLLLTWTYFKRFLFIFFTLSMFIFCISVSRHCAIIAIFKISENIKRLKIEFKMDFLVLLLFIRLSASNGESFILEKSTNFIWIRQKSFKHFSPIEVFFCLCWYLAS